MQRIGRYQIHDELGRGAMGVVYRALDPAIGRTVAIKTIRLSELVDPAERQKLRDRLMREAQSAGILSHPGIVTIYDVAEQGDVAYIAMEFVNGPTLDRFVRTTPPEGALVLQFLSQTAAALDYAHKRGIVHRDIKPANIMIHEHSTAKITDFGVAKIQSHQMTQAGSMVGTPNYMSPEQIQGQPVDGRSDQFSLAVIAYELLTGEKPFTADSLAALAFRIVKEDPAPVQRLNPTLDWPVDTVLRRALSKNAADRYPSCSDFTVALENACRACRKWQPLAAGAAQNMATVVDRAAPAAVAPVVAAPPAKRKVAEPPEDTTDAAAPAPVPRPLRLLRTISIAVFGAALVGAMIIGGLEFFENQEPPPQAQAQAPVTEAPVQRAPRPSAMPTTPEEGSAPVGPPPEPLAEAAPAPPPAKPVVPPKPVGGETRIVTNPPGAFVVVDGVSEQSCTSPCVLPLKPGRHTLSATLAGYRRTLRIFEAPRDAELFLNMDRASGTVIVRSDPQGASIVVDGQDRNERTPAMLNLPAGPHTIEVVRNGQRESQKVIVADGAISHVSAKFE